jgi:tetratricopeptide (TPR) repeat protein
MNMVDAKDLRNAMRASTKLMESGQYEEALAILDRAIKSSLAASPDTAWIRTLYHHAAVIADFAAKPDLVKRYYEESLRCDPKNPRALYGLAKAYSDEGDVQLSVSYAKRCYDVLNEGTHSENRGLLQLIAKRWPELAKR